MDVSHGESGIGRIVVAPGLAGRTRRWLLEVERPHTGTGPPGCPCPARRFGQHRVQRRAGLRIEQPGDSDSSSVTVSQRRWRWRAGSASDIFFFFFFFFFFLKKKKKKKKKDGKLAKRSADHPHMLGADLPAGLCARRSRPAAAAAAPRSPACAGRGRRPRPGVGVASAADVKPGQEHLGQVLRPSFVEVAPQASRGVSRCGWRDRDAVGPHTGQRCP